MEDTRNTDNAWFETLATNYHDDKGTVLHRITPEARDPTLQFVWMEATAELPVRNTHHSFVKEVCLSQNHERVVTFIQDGDLAWGVLRRQDDQCHRASAFAKELNGPQKPGLSHDARVKFATQADADVPASRARNEQGG